MTQNYNLIELNTSCVMYKRLSLTSDHPGMFFFRVSTKYMIPNHLIFIFDVDDTGYLALLFDTFIPQLTEWSYFDRRYIRYCGKRFCGATDIFRASEQSFGDDFPSGGW